MSGTGRDRAAHDPQGKGIEDDLDQPSKGNKEMTLMKFTQTIMPVLALVTAFAAVSQAHADVGRVAIKNCGYDWANVCIYGGDDAPATTAQDTFDVPPFGGTEEGTCRGNWSQEGAPRCVIDLGFAGNTCERPDLRYSTTGGSYTVWQDGDLFYLNWGTAADCEARDHFVLTDAELPGCSSTPELTIYGIPDRTGEAYTLRNFAMPDLAEAVTLAEWENRQYSFISNKNEWVRAIKLSRGRWEICKDAEYGGECLTLWGDGSWARLDTDWNGEWDRQITSIRPIACQ